MNPRGKRVVITGLGVVSSIGIGKDAYWESLLQAKSGIGPVSAFDTSAYFTHNGGEVKNFEPCRFMPEETAAGLNRSAQMALAATKLALTDSGLNLHPSGNSRLAVSMGTTFGPIQAIETINNLLLANQKPGNHLFLGLPTQSLPSAVARHAGCAGPSFMFSTACSAGNYAVGYGFDLIKLGRADLVLAGGSDPFSRIAFTGFNQFSAVAPQRCQPFDKNRKGMMVAEGAGVLILESLESALERKAAIYAEILGYGLSCDAHHMTTASVEGIAACMRKALQEAGIATGEVDYISAHGTGTVANDRAETAAIREVFGDRYRQIPVSSIKSMIGHTMGAASALESIACALTVRHDMIPPTINFETPDPECDIDCVPNKARATTVSVALNNSYAFGGNNASLVLKKFIQ